MCVCVCMYACMHVCMYVCMYVCMCVCIPLSLPSLPFSLLLPASPVAAHEPHPQYSDEEPEEVMRILIEAEHEVEGDDEEHDGAADVGDLCMYRDL